MPIHRRPRLAISVSLVVLATGACALATAAQDDDRWPVHSMERPQPPTVEPGPVCEPGDAPSDAAILFDGRSSSANLDSWRGRDGAAGWTVKGDHFEVKPGSGDIATAKKYGDVQFHIEWQVPADRAVNGQSGANSGIFFMGRYEVQICQANGNTTYADGTAGSLYGQYPPLANPCRPAGEWNSYDIVFRAPRFAEDGSLVSPARATVHFNGVLVQDAQTFDGATAHARRASYSAHGLDAIRLQDHGDPIRFRNVWVRPLD